MKYRLVAHSNTGDTVWFEEPTIKAALDAFKQEYCTKGWKIYITNTFSEKTYFIKTTYR